MMSLFAYIKELFLPLSKIIEQEQLDRRTLLSRFRTTVRRMGNQGVFWFLSLVFSATLGGISILFFMSELKAYSTGAAIAADVEEILNSAHDLRPLDKYAGLLSMILTPLNNDPETYFYAELQGEEIDCRKIIGKEKYKDGFLDARIIRNKERRSFKGDLLFDKSSNKIPINDANIISTSLDLREREDELYFSSLSFRATCAKENSKNLKIETISKNNCSNINGCKEMKDEIEIIANNLSDDIANNSDYIKSLILVEEYLKNNFFKIQWGEGFFINLLSKSKCEPRKNNSSENYSDDYGEPWQFTYEHNFKNKKHLSYVYLSPKSTEGKKVCSMSSLDLRSRIYISLFSSFTKGIEKIIEKNLQTTFVYFISREDHIMFWNPENEPPPFPLMYPWSAAPYFQSLEKATPNLNYIETKAYIDFGGNGIVKSICYKVRDIKENKDVERLFGALCFDFQIDIDYLITELRKRHLLHVELLKIPKESIFNYEEIEYEPRSWFFSQRSPKEETTSELIIPLDTENEKLPLGVITSWLDRKFPNRNDLVLTQRIHSLKYDEERFFLVPISMNKENKVNKNAWFLVVSAQKVSPTLHLLFSLGLSIFFIISTMLSSILGAARARAIEEDAEKAALFRSFPYGLLVTDDRDHIKYANRKAASLLSHVARCHNLPRPGSWIESSLFNTPSIMEVIEKDIVPIKEGTTLAVESFRARIPNLRERGIASAYYAKLRIEKTFGEQLKEKEKEYKAWVRLSASPINFHFDYRNSGRGPGSFALIEGVTEEEYKKHIKNHWNNYVKDKKESSS